MAKTNTQQILSIDELTDVELNELFMSESLYYFIKKAPIIIDGKPFNFYRHPFQIDIIKDTHPDQTWEKSAQMGASTVAIVKAAWSCRYIYPHGIMYLIPTRTDVVEFSKKKFQKVVDENEQIKSWIKDTDSATMKRIGNSFILFRGMQSSVSLKVQDVDCLIYDEIEEASEQMINLAERRLDHSEFKHRLRLSVPSDNDTGIDKYFQQTDQRFWMVKCSKCNNYFCMEDSFPECILDHGDWAEHGCPKCKRKVDIKIGQWVAKYPSITDKRGYHWCQLFSTYIDPKSIIDEYRRTIRMAWFYNHILGLPYTDVESRISANHVLSLCGDDLMVDRSSEYCVMGVDPGKVSHIVLGYRVSENKLKIIRLGVAYDSQTTSKETLSSWDILARIMARFNVQCCIIDGRPYPDDARTFARRFPGRVYLFYGTDSNRGITQWHSDDFTVITNHCESMDASHRLLLDRLVELPKRSALVETFAKHCHMTGRKIEEDPDTGDRRTYWKKLGENHFRMAYNLMVLASDRVPITHNERVARNRAPLNIDERFEGYGG